jgi:Domain of unknown function (DUF2760)
MKTYIIIGAIVIAILGGLLPTPIAAGHSVLIAEIAIIVCLAVLALVSVAAKHKATSSETKADISKSVSVPPPVQQPPPGENQAESEIVAFFALLQEKGRLVDFLMEDVAGYDDAEVGAAARVIHQGCKQVLQEYFKISPVSDAPEGTQVTVPAGYATDQYRVVGKLSGEAPFTGTLLHKGWKTEFVKLPRIVTSGRLPSIAPAEVEIK